jgi:hypothetical protein
MFRITICSLAQPQIPTFFSKYEEICRKCWQKFICALGESTPPSAAPMGLSLFFAFRSFSTERIFHGVGVVRPTPNPNLEDQGRPASCCCARKQSLFQDLHKPPTHRVGRKQIFTRELRSLLGHHTTTPKDGTDRLSRNVGKDLPLYAA